MEKRRVNKYLDVGTLFTYAILSMIFSIAIIVFAALLLQADILSWNPTVLVSVFFVLSGGICGAFLLLK